MTLQKKLEKAVRKAEANSALFEKIVQGQESPLQTKAGLIKSLPILLKELDQKCQLQAAAFLRLKVEIKGLDAKLQKDQKVFKNYLKGPQKTILLGDKRVKTVPFQMEEVEGVFQKRLLEFKDLYHEAQEIKKKVLALHKALKSLVDQGNLHLNQAKVSEKDPKPGFLGDKVKGGSAFLSYVEKSPQGETLTLTLRPQLEIFLRSLLSEKHL